MSTSAATSAADLARDWLRTVQAALDTDAQGLTAAIVEQGDRLLRRWSEPHRRYHDVAHLSAVLAALDLLTPDPHPSPDPHPVPDPRPPVQLAARLAAWFHDAVYAGQPGADEEASAALAEQVLPPLGVHPELVAEVARLVRLTATHDPAQDDAAGALLVDADLAVLASGPAEYARYTAAVRAEYAHVPDAMFRFGRAQVLKALLDKPFLYRTGRGHQLWESPARANVTAELAALIPPPPPPLPTAPGSS